MITINNQEWSYFLGKPLFKALIADINLQIYNYKQEIATQLDNRRTTTTNIESIFVGNTKIIGLAALEILVCLFWATLYLKENRRKNQGISASWSQKYLETEGISNDVLLTIVKTI